jgi:hypothetical protein
MPPGFNPNQLLTLQVQTAGQRFRDAGTTHRFFNQAIEAVRQVPGVTAVGFTSQLPLTGDEDEWRASRDSAARGRRRNARHLSLCDQPWLLRGDGHSAARGSHPRRA